MIRYIRYKLSEFFFRLGKNIHPDISELKAKIIQSQKELGIVTIKVDSVLK